MDTHNSLKLCYSINAFEDFKTVYLVFYREELSNEQIKAMIKDPQSDWIGENKTSLVEYLCRKVALEESMLTLDNSEVHPSCDCNINLNNSLKADKEENNQLSIEHLCKAVEIAERKYLMFSNSKSVTITDTEQLDRFSETYYNNPLFIQKLLPLFDVFLLYGRMFEDKQIRSLIKQAISQGYDIRHKLLKISNFVAGIIDDPSKFLKIFNPMEVKVIMQALYLPQKVRIPEPSDLQLNSFNNVQVSRNSNFVKMLEPFITDFKNDRYNKEYYKICKDYFKSDDAQQYAPLQNKLRRMGEKFIGKVHDYTSLYISDLEAEYITCPLYIPNYCYKKMLFMFVSQTVINETTNNITIYTRKDILSNEHYNEVILPQNIHGDYLDSLQLYSATQNALGRERLGTIDVKDNESNITQNSYPPWFIEAYEEMRNSLLNVEYIISSKREFFYDTKRFHDQKVSMTLGGKTLSNFLNKNLDTKCNKIKAATDLNMDLLDPFQKNILHQEESDSPIGLAEHDYLMQRAYKLLKTFTNFDEISETDFETLEMQRFNILIRCVFILAKAGRLDVISKYSKIKEFRNIFNKDKDGLRLIEKIETLVQAIECYQNGKWESAVNIYIEFLTNNYQIMDVDQWLRIYETVWYLAIATYFKYHLYLPVSAFNFVYEDCKIIEDENDYNQNYYTIHSYERQIDLETPKEKNFDKVFIRLINNFELVCKNVLEFKPQYSQKVLIAMFNMIGTLITNAETCSDKLCSSLDYYIETISQTESLQNENVEKFIQYFGDKVCCNQFRIDFFEIEAPDKNYTLYNDISENANNQFFAILKITPKSASPDEVVEANYREYYCSKASMILSHRTLVHSLRLKIKNCILQINSAKHISRRPLKMNEFVWISMSDHGDTRKIATECYRNADFYPAVEKLYTLKLKLFNIFFNHYTIRNSLDTHFIAAKLNFIEDTLGEVRLTLSQKIQEIECPSNESFNPFIEIGADHEEAKFVSAGDKQDQIQEAVSQAAEDLREAYQELDNTMKAWFMTLPEPETLNVGAKQATLKRKLRWEKMMSSKAKIRELQTVFRKVKMSKKKK